MRSQKKLKVFMSALLLAGSVMSVADERYDGSTTIRGEGEVYAIPDLSNMSVKLQLNCWKDFGALQGAADKFHNDVVAEMKRITAQGEHRYSAPGVSLFPQTLTLPKEVERAGSVVTIQVPDPECTKVNAASETINLKFIADFIERETVLNKNPELTGFEEVAAIRNALAKIISQHVNNDKVNGIQASLEVEYQLTPKYQRHLRDLARAKANEDYKLQYADRAKLCQWLESKVVSVNYDGGAPAYRDDFAGYAKRSLSAEATAIAPSSLHPGETPVPAAVTVQVSYVASTQQCKVP